MTTIAPARRERACRQTTRAAQEPDVPPSPGAIANLAAASLWDGDEGETWSRDWQQWDLALAGHQKELLGAAQIRRGEHVLDVGCGNGASARAAARQAVHGTVLGVDLSTRMLDRAKTEAEREGLRNVRFALADAEIHPFRPEHYDLVLSRFGTTFFGDPVAAFTNLARAIRPGGRLVSVVWQGFEQNDWLREINVALGGGEAPPCAPLGAPGPLAQADPSLTARLLHCAGFSSIHIDAVRQPLWLGADVEGAFAFVCGGGMARCLLDGLDGSSRSRALDSLRSTIESHATADGVVLGSAAWIVSARRPGC